MPKHDFLLRLHRFYQRHDGTVVSVHFLLMEEKKPDAELDPIEGVLVVSQGSSGQLVFDPAMWKAKANGREQTFHTSLPDLKTIYLPFSRAKNGEDIPRFCLDSLEPVEGAGVAWPEILKTDFTIWMRADCPD